MGLLLVLEDAQMAVELLLFQRVEFPGKERERIGAHDRSV